MFTPAQQRRYFNRKLKKIYHLLCSVRRPEIDADLLHDLRVACKHLKALVALVNYCNEDVCSISLKKLIPLYKLAGKIRNSQLVLLHLEKNQISCSCLVKEHQSIVDLESADFFLQTRNFKKDIKGLQEKTEFLHPLSPDKISDYYSRQTQKLTFIFSLPEDIEVLHECRKIIKGMLLPLPGLPGDIRNSIRIDMQWFNDIEQRIGKLHDQIMVSKLVHEKQCSHGEDLAIMDKNILLLYTCIRDVFSINNKTDFGHDSSTCLWVN